jgi:hypothetical protein
MWMQFVGDPEPRMLSLERTREENYMDFVADLRTYLALGTVYPALRGVTATRIAVKNHHGDELSSGHLLVDLVGNASHEPLLIEFGPEVGRLQ